jgi:maltose alpha-D-glucosyltransferase/alpha-amylase
LPEAAQSDARRVLDAEPQVEARYRALLDAKLTAHRIRVHGDFHAGQVLWTGRDVVIIDFEGEPARPLSERRRKRSALVDVAGMIRSFHYAAYGALLSATGAGPARPGDPAALEPWLAFWYVHVAASFLRGYRDGADDGVFVPRTDDEIARLLDAFLLEKAIYEVGYEMNNRPDWVSIPLRGIAELLSS